LPRRPRSSLELSRGTVPLRVWFTEYTPADLDVNLTGRVGSADADAAEHRL